MIDYFGEDDREICFEKTDQYSEVVEDNELPSNKPAITVAIPNPDNEIWPCINIIKVKESVYNGAILGNPKDRFTMTHEFAHAKDSNKNKSLKILPAGFLNKLSNNV